MAPTARIAADAMRNVRSSVRERTRLGRAVGPHSPHAACIGSHKDDFERPSTIGRRGARRRLPRDVRFHAHREARAQRDARPARRRPASVRLLRRDAAAAAAQRRGPRRARGDLPHALPRRPLPRAPRDAQDLLVARPRAAAHDLRAARPRRAALDAPAHVRAADVPRSSRGARARRRSRARRVPDRDVRRRARRDRDRLRARRGRAPGSLRRRRRDRARRAGRTASAACSSEARA